MEGREAVAMVGCCTAHDTAEDELSTTIRMWKRWLLVDEMIH